MRNPDRLARIQYGVELGFANTDDPTKPDYTRPEVVAAQADLDLIHDLLAGTRRMFDRAGRYIPKWKDESDTVWLKRAKCEQVYEGLGRTLSASVGKLFQAPPQLTAEVMADEFTAHWDNIDARGNKGPVAAKHFASDAIADGYAIVLVDHPAPPDDAVVTMATEQALNLRPVWAFYPRSSVMSWRVDVIANVERTTQLVLAETDAAPVGAYGVEMVERYRVLYVRDGVAGYQVYRAIESQSERTFELEAEGVFRDRQGRTRDTLPIAVAYTGRTVSPFTAVPPLLGVAWANLGHWQQASNLRFYRELAAFPQPTVRGALIDGNGDPAALKLGPMVLVQLADTGEFKWTELAGSALDQVEKGVHAKEQQMAAMGVSFLSRDTRGAETAEAKRLDAAAEDSTLATAAQAIEDALNLALEHHAWYLGVPKDQAPVIALNRDYEAVTLSPQHAQAIAALIQAGMPIRQAVATLVVGGFLAATEDEIDLITMEWEAGRMGLAATAELATADALALNP
jgi:hypothetical protein